MRGNPPVTAFRIPLAAWLLIVLLVGVAGQAGARGRFMAVLDREEVPLHEEFTLTVTVPSGCSANNLPRSRKYDIVARKRDRGQAMGSVSRTNTGKVRRSSGGYTQKVLYVLKANVMGKLVFRPSDAKETTNMSAAGGTLLYMSPEQHLGSISKASDIYALGICLYEMLTGQLPFIGADIQRKKETMRYIPATKLVPELPTSIDGLIANVLATNPLQRVSTAAELLAKLQTCAGGQP